MNTYVYEFEGNLYLNLTNRCPNSCEFCVRNFQDGVGENKLWLNREPTYEDLIDAISLYDLKKYGEVVFCGFGEPMCALDLISQIAPYLKRKGAVTRINTNGLGDLINKRENVPKLIAPYIDNVSISLNASNADDYDAICKSKFGRDAFYAMLKFAKECVEAGINTTMTVVDFVGEDEIRACERLAKNAGAHFRVRATIHEGDEY